MTAVQNPDKRPWFKEPFVWMVLFFPSLAIVAGTYTLFLAVTTSDGLVVDDYYKQGLEINRTLERDFVAQDYGLQSALQINRENLMLQVQMMQENKAYQLPQQISLNFRHRTRSGFDQSLSLQLEEGSVYRGQLEKNLQAGWWTVQMEADNWRLQGRMRHTMSELWLSPPILSKDS